MVVYKLLDFILHNCNIIKRSKLGILQGKQVNFFETIRCMLRKNLRRLTQQDD